MLEDILLKVNKPARYIGQEWNVSRKDPDSAFIKFALCFPDLYEVGMSNLGLRILYGILNDIADVACERVFSCSEDMENTLYDNQQGIFSLESKRCLREFDIIGFSLGSELDYSNVLNILQLGGIPPEAALRNQSFPLVIAGGPCTLNPEPMHEFFDLFVIGEAEELIIELIDVYRANKEKFKTAKLNKQDLLYIFSQIEGVYAPSLYEVSYGPDGALLEFRPKIKGMPAVIKKRFVRDLNSAYFPLGWLVPYIQIIHDRLTLEIMRGCPNQCRFCQARAQYFPFRLRSRENILGLASKAYQCTGYEEMSLAGLSVGDYPDIEELVQGLVSLFKTKGVSVSLPSVKAKAMVGRLSSLIATVKKTSLTFAPEAGSPRLRSLIAKDFSDEDLFSALEEAYGAGYQHIKLYFMIGLPSEEKADLDAIIHLATSASELRRKAGKGPAQVNISINALIPKPHTPLQWLRMEDMGAIKEKQDYLKDKARNKRLNLSFHNCKMSFLEGILSRGDRRLSRVILGAFKQQAKFDAWSNYFSLDKWLAGFSQANIDPYSYLQERPKESRLPWDFVDVGMDKDALRRDAQRIYCNKSVSAV